MNEQPNPLCDEIRNIARDAPMPKGTRTRLHAIAHDIDKVLTAKLGEWKDEGWYDQYAIAGKKLYPFSIAASAPETSQSTSKTNLQRYVAMPFEDSAGNEFPANMEAIDGGEWVRYEDVQHLLRTAPETLGCPHCTEAYRIWETNATVDSVRVLNQMRDAVAVGMFRKVTQEASASETPQSISNARTSDECPTCGAYAHQRRKSLSSKDQLDTAWSDFCRDTPVALRGPWEAFKYAWETHRAAPETSDYLGNQIYALLVRRGYAQHEAHLVASGPGCTSDCVQKGYPDVDCPEHGAAQKKERTNQGDSDCVMPGDWPLTAKRPAQETPAAHLHQFVDGSDPEQQVCTGCASTRATPEETSANESAYQSICQGGTGGRCCDPECQTCWPDRKPTKETSPTISLENGKYVFFKDSEGLVSCHRYAEPWRTFLGDKAISCLFEYTWYLQQTLLYTTTQRISDMIRRHVDLRKPSD